MAFEKAMQESFKILQLPDNVKLKKEQESALRAVVLQKKDCLCFADWIREVLNISTYSFRLRSIE